MKFRSKQSYHFQFLIRDIQMRALFSGDMDSAMAYYGEYRGLSQSVQESYGVTQDTILWSAPKS